MLETFIPQLLNKSLEVILTLLLEKLLKWLLTHENCQHLNHLLKMQILVLYMDWVLLKTPLNAIIQNTAIAVHQDNISVNSVNSESGKNSVFIFNLQCKYSQIPNQE